MYMLIEQLARVKQQTLLAEAEAWRAARAARAADTAASGSLRRAAGRWLIDAGARLAGAAVVVGYEPAGAGPAGSVR